MEGKTGMPRRNGQKVQLFSEGWLNSANFELGDEDTIADIAALMTPENL